ncbi:MAG: GNAT family N-acetyltransferase [Gammaproteobacteria bacterium]|nr:MAG: GNAT family N-acetyltransferase [Gammaproteobacteria bacterium]
MNKVLVRTARLDELETLLQFEQGIVEYERHMVPDMMTEHFNYYDLKELIENDDSEVLVAEVDGKLVASGYAKLKKSSNYLTHEYHSFLGFMFVSPDFRGKGINGKIVDQLTVWSKEKGATVLCLTVFAQNQSGIRAYEKIGFDKNVIEMRKDI